MNVKQILNTEDPYGDKFAQALYRMADQVKFALGYKFHPEDWEEIRQQVMLKLYEKVIPNLTGKNNYSYLRSIVTCRIKDYTRNLDRRIKPIDFSVDVDKLESKVMDKEEYVDILESLLNSGELNELETKRATKLLAEFKEH